MMTLPDVYCRVNRARGLELISTEDLLNACKALQQMNLPIQCGAQAQNVVNCFICRLRRFNSGVLVLELRDNAIENSVNDTVKAVSCLLTKIYAFFTDDRCTTLAAEVSARYNSHTSSGCL